MVEIDRNINIAFSRGKQACDSNKCLTDNPYAQGTPSWRAWRRGWSTQYPIRRHQTKGLKAMPKKRIKCEAILEIEYSDKMPEHAVLKMARDDLKSMGTGEMGAYYSYMLVSVKVPTKKAS